MWLIAGAERSYVDLYENGVIGLCGSGGAEAHIYYFYCLQDGALVLIDTAESDWGTYKVNGSACTEEVFLAKLNEYTKLTSWDFEIVKTIDREVS